MTPPRRERIQAVRAGLELIEAPAKGVTRPFPHDVEIAFGDPPLEDAIASPRLRWIQFRSAGIDAYSTSDALRRKDILLTTAAGVYSIPGAEHVLAMMLYFTRRLDRSIRQQLEGRWNITPIRNGMGELSGQTLALLGVGGFGLEIAKRARAFGMRVLGVKRATGSPVENVDQIFALEGTKKVIAQADHVVLTLPDTPATRGFFTAEMIAAMKPSACFYNIARGSLVDEPALIAALQRGRIAGAGLDVFASEPLPADSPLWKLPNVLITPHSAGRSPKEFDRMVDLFCDNLRLFLAGQPLRNRFDFNRGY